MKIAVFGLGGVGGYFGVRLADAGNHVIFLTRGATYKAVKKDGLELKSINGDVRLTNVEVVNNPSEIGTVDLILLCVKAWQVPEVALSLRPMIGDDTIILPLQNGVDSYSQLTDIYSREHVLQAMCRVVAFKSKPNLIEHTDVDPSITFGEQDNTRTDRINKIFKIFSDAKINAIIPEDILSSIWQKFLFVTSTSGIGAITRSPMGVIREIRETRNLFVRSINEIENLAVKKGIHLPGDVVEKSILYLDKLNKFSTSSTQRDIMEGRPSELENLTGAVVRIGKELNISTPVNEFIYSALLPMEMIARNLISRNKQ